MNQKFSVVALCVVVLSFTLAVTSRAGDVLFEQLKIGDDVVKNVRVTKATPLEVVIVYDGGGSSLKRDHLPSELAALYPYDAKAAADFERERAKADLERTNAAKVRQAEASKELKASLLRQKVATKTRIEELQREADQLEKELSPMKGKAANRPKSQARKELDRALDRKQDLIHRLGEQKDMLKRINKQLDALP